MGGKGREGQEAVGVGGSKKKKKKKRIKQNPITPSGKHFDGSSRSSVSAASTLFVHFQVRCPGGSSPAPAGSS